MSIVKLSQVTVIVFFLSIPLGLAGCKIGLDDLVNVKGSGTTLNQTRTLGSFSAIDLEGATDIQITQGAVQSVRVTADDNIVPLITTTVKNGRLIISSTKSYSTQNDVRVTVVVPKIEAIEINGSGDVELNAISANKLKTTVSGSGNITAEGRVDTFTAIVNGSGDIDAEKLLAKNATVRVTGSGSVVLNSSDTLDADVTGSGDISYDGTAKVKASITGSGSVDHL
ncbi:head GIN domain-containing protein [Aquirhabdus parva]|uniref:DUF2807 domain-containing protein n=1 Tax=Aquirhabdus parva TaxID=2283318 RepID=A0A345P4N2_9GAMM|nr:head GIN domain-containing protein [Aquirhabdus parva]AXI02241.1 DUF2807 domain-containing protein [Aquirhabdus parva]